MRPKSRIPRTHRHYVTLEAALHLEMMEISQSLTLYRLSERGRRLGVVWAPGKASVGCRLLCVVRVTPTFSTSAGGAWEESTQLLVSGKMQAQAGQLLLSWCVEGSSTHVPAGCHFCMFPPAAEARFPFAQPSRSQVGCPF